MYHVGSCNVGRDTAGEAATSQAVDQAIAGRLEFTDLGPEALVADLEARGHEALLVTGGGEIYAAFADAGLVDEWMVAVGPVLLGGGTPLFSHVAEQQLALREHRSLNHDTLLLHYDVVHEGG